MRVMQPRLTRFKFHAPCMSDKDADVEPDMDASIHADVAVTGTNFILVEV